MMMIKGKGAALLCVVMILMASAVYAQNISVMNAAGNSDTIWGLPGDEVVATIHGPGNDINGVNFTVTYDAALLENTDVGLGSLNAGQQLSYNEPTPGEIRLMIYNDPVQDFSAETGTFAELTFTVKDGLSACQTGAVAFMANDAEPPEELGVSTGGGQSITDQYSFVDGSFKVTQLGDINRNGTVDLIDFSMLSARWGQPGYDLIAFSKLSATWGKTCD